MSLKTTVHILHAAQTINQNDLAVIDESHSGKEEDFAQPPRRLTNDATHKDFRPDFMRIGVRIDGVERSDVAWYDADRNEYRTIRSVHAYGAESIEPYWRNPETRQDRRMMERWRKKHQK